jgi:D-amino-acid oxidase
LADLVKIITGKTLSEYQSKRRSEDVDTALAERIAMRCVALAPELTGGKGVESLDIVRHGVGLRPSRHGGARVETEVRDYGLVVHNYGETMICRES